MPRFLVLVVLPVLPVPQVRDSYRTKGWALLDVEKVEQCHHEGCVAIERVGMTWRDLAWMSWSVGAAWLEGCRTAAVAGAGLVCRLRRLNVAGLYRLPAFMYCCTAVLLYCRFKEEIEAQKGEGCHLWGELHINKASSSCCCLLC
jgi:hypothetical protein